MKDKRRRNWKRQAKEFDLLVYMKKNLRFREYPHTDIGRATIWRDKNLAGYAPFEWPIATAYLLLI